MFEKSQVVSHIMEFFGDKLFVEVESPTSDLFDAALLDSIGIVELLLFLEQSYSIEFPMQNIEMDDLRTVAAIADMVRGRIEGKPCAAEPAPVAASFAPARPLR